jgi:hypothetical protein
MSSLLVSALLWLFSLFGVLTTKGEKRVISIVFIVFSFPHCVMDMCSMCDSCGGQEPFMCGF